MTHAWCTDVSRDAAVRAAEDGRDGAVPTLEEAIGLAFGFDKASAQRACDEVKSWPEDVQKDCRFVLGDSLEQGVPRLQALVEAWRYGKGLVAARYPGMFPKSVSASSQVDHENKGDGMRAERVTLEIAYHPEWCDGGESIADRVQRIVLHRVLKRSGESVRVVEEELSDAWAQRLARLTAERDAAIRERDSWKILADRTNERLSAAEARVAELEAASGGNGKGTLDGLEQEPVAWGISNPGHPDCGNCEVWTVRTTEEIAKAVYSAAEGWQHFPLYRSPPQPRGWLTEDQKDAVRTAREHLSVGLIGTEENSGWYKVHKRRVDALNALLARSTPPEVVLPESGATDEWLPDFARGCGVGGNKCIDQVRAALAAAGVAVKEVGSE